MLANNNNNNNSTNTKIDKRKGAVTLVGIHFNTSHILYNLIFNVKKINQLKLVSGENVCSLNINPFDSDLILRLKRKGILRSHKN